ncbi:short-chain dehydrogenase/reductase family 16C member 6 [Diachasma alloeum]|uniref:short-chain dehydrogenase/reductase family 16C member 6 n=1 Tax=Diachasma alloeum TaxID=454923 RepID=UPI00073849AF|nr:short-chain dehydrogenase/reductase family 16C member 6 [Diachasma alloeum]XP_015126334.1 short-chain dehydrogenase/reductase family 16C member 6 [Diachasma alloeum]
MVNAYDGVLILADVCLLFVKIFFSILESTYRLFVPVEEKSVAGEIVLITGAGHGIGRELALKYASLGGTVVCWDLDPQGNRETVDEVMKLGATKAHAYKCDVTNREEVFKVAERVKAEVGNVTILVNNAGIMPCQPFMDHTPEVIQKLFDVNVMAHFWMLQAFLPTMITNNHGHVVALSSIAGIVGLTNVVPYCASKFAVRGLMEALTDEIKNTTGSRGSNIRFTTIYPYMVDTGLCKKPKIRFPSLMALVPPKEAAAQIVTAQRRNYAEASIPRHWLTVNTTFRNFPEKVWSLIKTFLDSGLEAHT